MIDLKDDISLLNLMLSPVAFPLLLTAKLYLSQPIRDWPEVLDDSERWEYFLSQCAGRNISQTEITDCAYDSGGGSFSFL